MGRILHLCFIPNAGAYNRYLPLSDIRGIDVRKDGTELVIEFSAITVIIVGRLGRAAAYIGINRCAGLEAFDENRRDSPTEPTNPDIESIRFYAAKQPETGGKKPKAKPAAAKSQASPDEKVVPLRPQDAGQTEGETP